MWLTPKAVILYPSFVITPLQLIPFRARRGRVMHRYVIDRTVPTDRDPEFFER